MLSASINNAFITQSIDVDPNPAPNQKPTPNNDLRVLASHKQAINNDIVANKIPQTETGGSANVEKAPHKKQAI